MKTDLGSVARIAGIAGIAGNRIAFEPPTTGSRTQPNLRTPQEYYAAVTKLHGLGRLLDEAVIAEGLEITAVHRAWNVLSNNCDVLTMVFPEHATSLLHDIAGFVSSPPAQYACSICLGTGMMAGHGRSGGVQIDLTAGIIAEVPDRPNKLVEQTERTSAWMDVTAQVLRNSRPMTASEHRLAAKALWDDVE